MLCASANIDIHPKTNIHIHARTHLHRKRDNIFKHNYEVQDSHQTRQSNLLFIEKCNSVFASKQPYFTFPVMWNKWNHIIPDFTSHNNLKSQLKGYLLSHYANTEMLKQILQTAIKIKTSKHMSFTLAVIV